MRRGWSIAGTGSYLPQRVVNNHDLVDVFGLDTDNEWIVQRTGIKQRHIAENGETTSQMAALAAQKAIDSANINADDIDLIILATTSPDYTFPSVASIVQNCLGCRAIPAFDLQGVCSGFLYAIITADAWIQAGFVKNVLVIGAETMSSIVNWQDRRTAVLFGDGAGALVLRADSNVQSGLLSHSMHCDGSLRDILKTDGGPSSSHSLGKIMMTGQEVFRHAVQKLSSSCLQAMEKIGCTINDIDKIIPHQANARILSALQEKLNADDSQIVSTVALHANTSAASIPLALDYAWRHGTVVTGQTVLITAIGGGLTWGACIIKI